jgi:outer membrane receptor protein involved in Fe transport
MLVFFLGGTLLTAAASVPLQIDVQDAVGGVIRNAAIHVVTTAGPVTATTDAAGRAEVTLPVGETAVITVRAPGFAPARRTYNTDAAPQPVRIVLEPAALDLAVTVTAARSERVGLRAAPSTSVLESADLASAPGITLDDALRHTPGFSLFRRTSSRVANPTTHGVTLRGLSASGASRTLVLADGVPLNDAFGGWVSWNRVPLAAIDRVEVVRGSASDLYGPDALGGVIQLFTIAAARRLARAYVDGGGQDTGRGSFAGAIHESGWHAMGAFEAATSNGYVTVAPEDRGPIDERAGGSHRSGTLRLGAEPAGWSVRGGAHVFAERRQNGTPFQRNDTATRSADVGVSRAVAGGLWRVTGFVGNQGYDQTFSAVAGDRGSELPTQVQRVPSETFGASTDWATGSTVRLLAGVEQRQVRAVNQEVRFVAGVPAGTARAGGRQQFVGGFGQLAFDPVPSMTALAGARVERWSVRSFQGDEIEDETLFAPRLALAWQPRGDVALRGSVSRSFRAPTLNERFRGFRVGDTQTRPNALLEPERLTAVEVGASMSRGAATLRATGFYNHLSDAIANVTVSTTPTLITRERRNAGAIDARGVELEGSVQVVSGLSVSAGAMLVSSTFGDDSPGGLAGNRTPQSPRSHLMFDVRWDDLPTVAAVARVMIIGAQFEDDRNTLELGRATLVDVMLSRSFARGWLGFVAVDNLFDSDYDVGRTPLRTIGTPRFVRAGLRVTLQ